MILHAPWSAEVITALRQHQADPQRHPYTCPGGDQCPAADAQRALIPTTYGWVCVCGRYGQDWAHSPFGGSSDG